METKSGVASLYEDAEKKYTLKYDDKEKADILMKQFSNAFTKEPVGDPPIIPKRTTASVTVVHVTEYMVKKKLEKFNPNNYVARTQSFFS